MNDVENRSDVACLRRRIAMEEEAAQRGLYGFALVASHELITARMELGVGRLARLALGLALEHAFFEFLHPRCNRSGAKHSCSVDRWHDRSRV